MLKKITVASLILAASSSVAFASASPYVGAALGINTVTSKSGSNFRGVPVDLFAGYGATINTNLYLGGEVFLTPVTTNISSYSNTYSVRTTYGYGASVLPGIMFSDHTFGYIRAGVVESHFRSDDSTVFGAQLGLGMQTTVAQNFDLRTEYVFTTYNKMGSAKSDAFKLGLVYKFE